MNTALINTIEKMTRNKIKNYALPGLTSYLVGGENHGRVTLFHAERTIEELVVPHTNQFNWHGLVLSGHMYVISYIPSIEFQAGWSLWRKSEIVRNGAEPGNYKVKQIHHNAPYMEATQRFEAGSSISINVADIHSIKFYVDTKLLSFEEPDSTDTSFILEPVVDGEHIPTFKTEEWMFKRETP